MTVSMEVISESDGAIAIPSRRIIDILKTLPDTPITFNINPENLAVEITADNCKFNDIGQKSEEYPKTPTFKSSNSFTINSLVLHKIIDKTIFATANDEIKPALQGVFFNVKNNFTDFVATDSHRLIKYTRHDVKSDQEFSFIMPKKPLMAIRESLSRNDTIVTVQSNNENALFSFNNYRLICKLINAKYPNYDAVIPQENPNKLTIDRNTILNSIKRAAIYSNQSTYFVRLNLKGQNLTVIAEDTDYSISALENISCKYVGEDIQIGFNAKFLTETIASIDTEEIILESSTPNRACLIKMAENEIPEENIIALIMPIVLPDSQ